MVLHALDIVVDYGVINPGGGAEREAGCLPGMEEGTGGGKK